MSTDRGLLHLYYGDGKGKTTAGMGLVLRAVGRGKSVLVVQFLKSGSSGELEPLRKMGVRVMTGKVGNSFVKDMTEEEKRANRENNDRLISDVMESDAEIVLLDELCATVEYGLVNEELAKQAVTDRPKDREMIITGRHPAPWMKDAADYITKMECERHPAEKGIMAREGIEY